MARIFIQAAVCSNDPNNDNNNNNYDRNLDGGAARKGDSGMK